MAEPPVIRMEELRNAITRALVAAEERVGAEVTLTEDYYWHLPVGAAFDLSTEPSSLTVGRLTDDLEHVGNTTPVEPAMVWHDLAHLVGLLRAVERLTMS